MTGTLVNSAAILAGGAIGLLIKKGLPTKLQNTIYRTLGLVTLIIGLNGVITSMISVDPDTGALSSGGEMLLMVSLVVGAGLGTALRIDARLNLLGVRIENKFGANGFAKGFVSASILFCVGAMSIMGAINDGLSEDSTVLFIKSSLDGVAALILASSMGFGVLFSAIPVFLYQGGIALLAEKLSGVSADALSCLCMVGYVLVITIGTNLAFHTRFKTADYLPALLIPVLYQLLQPLIGW